MLLISIVGTTVFIVFRFVVGYHTLLSVSFPTIWCDLRTHQVPYMISYIHTHLNAL